MKFLRTLPLIVLFFSANAQEKTTGSVPLLKPIWGSVSFGTNLMTGIPSDSLTFQSLVKKDDPSLHPDLNGYLKDNFRSIDGGAEFSLSLACKLRKKDKSGFSDRAVFRISATYFNNSFFSDSYNKTKAVRFDTLTGQSNTFYLDSVYNYNYDFTYDIKQLGLEASLLYNTNPEKLFGLYGGVAIGQYFSMNNTVGVSYFVSSRVRQTDISGVSSASTSAPFNSNKPSYSGSYSVLEAKSCFTTNVSVPFGISLKLAKTKKFWKNIQLFLETKPGINITVIREIKTYSRVVFRAGSGIRILLF